MNHRALSFSVEEGGPSDWYRLVFLSVLLHGVALLAVWALERYTPSRTLDPSVLSVRLVGALPNASLSPAPQSSSSQRAAQNRPAPAEEKPASTASRIPLPVPQAERKAVSINPTEVKAPERTAAPQKLETPPPQPKSPLNPGEPGGGPKGAEASPKVASAAPGGGGGGKLTSEEARYLQMLQERIEENWRAYLPPDEGVLGEVRIQIGPDGRIREFTFVKGSGKSHVDSSIVTALKKVALAPPPASIADRPLVLRFWPSGPKS